MIDPMDYYLWQEVFDPDMKYECQNCGTLFGDECLVWNKEAPCQLAVCPACGAQILVDDSTKEGAR